MAILVKTDTPEGLLKSIKKAIDEKTIETWSYDADGDFTHTPDQWKNRAWLRPKVYPGELRFGILGPKNVVLAKAIYSIFHGRFIEMLLDHVDDKFTTAIATAQKSVHDNFD